MQFRTHTCGELRGSDIGKKVVLSGWYENLRKVSKSLAFLVLRDFYGVTQIVIETEEIMEQIELLNTETTIMVEGEVRERSAKNETLDTGEIEVAPEKITVLGRCEHAALPFEVNRSKEADENLRLRYRYLDLRNPAVKDRMIMRSEIVSDLRRRMTDEGFFEITTPILTCSSPEGARDYLVPSRNHPGKFYALPQAPQQFKQLLMTSGFDKYFQIAPCFRDEDARADRSPGEFYQLDMEMAFAGQEDVFGVIERVLPPVFERYGLYQTASKPPFTRIAYREAMERFGTDKPDLRIKLELADISEVNGCGFGPFEGNIVKALVCPAFSHSRKAIDKICADVEIVTGRKCFWFKVADDGSFAGGIAKFLPDYKDALIQKLGLKSGDLIFCAAGTLDEARKTAGCAIKTVAQIEPSYMNKECYNFCWIVDFPMYEIGEESGKIEFCHNPFSMPQGGIDAIKNTDPLDVLAYQYDLVCNGVELSSGAVRNHDPAAMVAAFEIAGLTEDDVKAKFPAMYNAFTYGAPPHAGIAPGIDRMVMLIAGEESIREVIPFPMNKSAMDVMMGAPSKVDVKQLEDVHIRVELPEKEDKENEDSAE